MKILIRKRNERLLRNSANPPSDGKIWSESRRDAMLRSRDNEAVLFDREHNRRLFEGETVTQSMRNKKAAKTASKIKIKEDNRSIGIALAVSGVAIYYLGYYFILGSSLFVGTFLLADNILKRLTRTKMKPVFLDIAEQITKNSKEIERALGVPNIKALKNVKLRHLHPHQNAGKMHDSVLALYHVYTSRPKKAASIEVSYVQISPVVTPPANAVAMNGRYWCLKGMSMVTLDLSRKGSDLDPRTFHFEDGRFVEVDSPEMSSMLRQDDTEATNEEVKQQEGEKPAEEKKSQ